MEETELQADTKRLRTVSKLLVWIIEYVWAHRMIDIREVVDPIYWPDMDSQPLSLDNTVRLRVASAQVYSIVKNRDVEQFERVMGFLESTYRLLPGLVAPIKHMKIMFGLKTMVVMWMLRAGIGMVETVCKIIKFFSSKLPQYQDQCNQHDMFLMRKNHVDFKTLAQTLAMDKNKLKDYVKNHMDEQYGDHYAQKVEDRLLNYLHKLETVLPGDTYIDKVCVFYILKKSSPVTEEEKLLLEIIACDTITIATTLKKLLHCDLALFRCRDNADQQMKSDDVFKKLGENSSKNSMEEISHRSKEPASSPHFCSKHQRWVKSILQECPDERSEELRLQANLSLSPLLFHSSSSTSSSQDITPSDLIPGPPDQPPPLQAFMDLETPAQASKQTNKQRCGSASKTSQTEPLPSPSFLPRDVLLPALLSPVVRHVDIASVTRGCPTITSHQPFANHFTMSSNQKTISISQVTSCSHSPTSPNKNFIFNQSESVLLTAPSSTSCQPTTRRPFSKLSRKYKRTLVKDSKKASTAFQINVPPVPDLTSVPERPTQHGSTSQSVQTKTFSLVFTSNYIPLPKTPPSTTGVSSVLSSNHLDMRLDISKVPTTELRQLLPKSTLLQPCISIDRLSSHECYVLTKGRCSARCETVLQSINDDEVRTENKDDTDSSFDPNALYSSHSSSSDSNDSSHYDPDYVP